MHSQKRKRKRQPKMSIRKSTQTAANDSQAGDTITGTKKATSMVKAPAPPGETSSPGYASSDHNLQVQRINGYVAISNRSSKTAGWLYLRKHSKSELFVGNLPQPEWFCGTELSKAVVSPILQERMKTIIKKMIASAEEVGDLFGTGNGRLATRVQMKGGEQAVDEVLSNPSEWIEVDWERLWWGRERKEGALDIWLHEYEDSRNVKKVEKWSEVAMKAYELREKRRKEEEERRKKEGDVVDEDGFTLVTKGAKQMKAAEAEKLGIGGRLGKGNYKSKSGKNRKSLLDVTKGIEKDGFYRWQRREKDKVKSLQARFKDDQKRIKAIQALGHKSDVSMED